MCIKIVSRFFLSLTQSLLDPLEKNSTKWKKTMLKNQHKFKIYTHGNSGNCKVAHEQKNYESAYAINVHAQSKIKRYVS